MAPFFPIRLHRAIPKLHCTPLQALPVILASSRLAQDASFVEREKQCEAFNAQHRWRKRGISR